MFYQFVRCVVLKNLKKLNNKILINFNNLYLKHNSNKSREFFKEEEEKSYFLDLVNLLMEVHINKNYISPKIVKIFRLFSMTNFDNIKVIMIGESPYPDNEIANGIAFATSNNNRIPPSLKNIFKEIKADLPSTSLESNDLIKWIERGIITINIYWTFLKDKKINKEINKYWLIFSSNLIRFIMKRNSVILIYFGKKALLLKQENNFCQAVNFCVSHPSPLSYYRTFRNAQLFTKINQHLSKPLNWST